MNIRINLILLAAALAAQLVSAQGPLTPPRAPTAMMKTLAQVEPRTAITNVPYTITQSGSYYLATNMVSAAAGVTIATNWVTLDLMGFTLAGNRSGGGHGIWIYSGGGTVPVQGVTVCNGSIRGTATSWSKKPMSLPRPPMPGRCARAGSRISSIRSAWSAS